MSLIPSPGGRAAYSETAVAQAFGEVPDAACRALPALGKDGVVTRDRYYTDQMALEAHRATPHFERLVAGTVLPLLESRTAEFYDLVMG